MSKSDLDMLEEMSLKREFKMNMDDSIYQNDGDDIIEMYDGGILIEEIAEGENLIQMPTGQFVLYVHDAPEYTYDSLEAWEIARPDWERERELITQERERIEWERIESDPVTGYEAFLTHREQRDEFELEE